MPITYGRASRVNVNLNSGGGTKKQGLKPTQTNYYIMSGKGGSNNYRTRGGGENRDMIFSVNQLSGGVGRNRGQFVTGARGTKRFEPYKYGASKDEANNKVCFTDEETAEFNSLIIDLSKYYGPGFCFVGDFENLRNDLNNAQGCGDCSESDVEQLMDSNENQLMGGNENQLMGGNENQLMGGNGAPKIIAIPVTDDPNAATYGLPRKDSDEIIGKVNRLNELVGKECLAINKTGNGGTCVSDLGKNKCALIDVNAQDVLQKCGFGVAMSDEISLPMGWFLPDSVYQQAGDGVDDLPGFNVPQNSMTVRAYAKA